MESSMYKGKITVIAIGMHEGFGLFIINSTEYIYIHKKFLSQITEMIKIPYLEKNEFKFQFHHILDGIQERNCFMRLSNGKFEATIDNKTQEICESLLQSFILAGFLKRFLMIEEARLAKPNFLQTYANQKKQEDIAREEIAVAMAKDNNLDFIEEEASEIYTGDVEGIPNLNINLENDIRLRPDIKVIEQPINNIKRHGPGAISIFRKAKERIIS